MESPRERGRGRIPNILTNGQAAAYSSFRRIRIETRERAGIRRQERSKSLSVILIPAVYFAAFCAHFASVLRKGLAPAGGSTSPVNAALNVTI
jgi:hypothetical protein